LDGAPVAKRARGGGVAAVASCTVSGGGSKVRLGAKKTSYHAGSSSSARMDMMGEELEEEELEEEEGYNSEDEYSYSHVGVNLSEEEWAEKDRR
jgi:hypothetical protein